MTAIEQVGVVVPAHNEEHHLGRALSGVQGAADALQADSPSVAVRVVVVLDACTDGSAEVACAFAAADPRFEVIEAGFRSVGKSRQAGVRALLPPESAAGVPASRVWIASTDADSRVPEHWLVRQLEIAAAGTDAVLGSVEPDPEGMDPAVARLWHARHRLEENHPHIYGANLGVRASAYLAAGGFPSFDAGEDRSLVDRLRLAGAAVYATDTTRVVTSGRLQARARRGFAAYLLALAQECAEVPAAPAR
jgi:glycosyltransferase involved in cell wall biosynthesis